MSHNTTSFYTLYINSTGMTHLKIV